jgi:lysophospholipid acyltransferase (LPLAT)-like uncharacterized protein
MAFAKRALKRPWVQATLAWFAARYIGLVKRTTRWRIEMPEATRALMLGERAAIACFWHGRLLVMRAAWQRKPKQFHMLISGHRDGAFIARAMRLMGMAVITGSGTSPERGGSDALREMRGVIARSCVVGVTPDGPRGPLMRAKGGAVLVGQQTGAPLVAVSGSVKRARMLKTWDRFLLAWPFNRGVILFGEPILVAADARLEEFEAARRRLEGDLIRLTAEADRLCGQMTAEPADDIGRRPKSRKKVRRKAHAPS